MCDDPDVTSREPWVHWGIYKISVTLREPPEGLPTDATPESPATATQAKNSGPGGRTVGYRNLAPPGGIHHYHFTFDASNRDFDVQPAIDKTALVKALEGRILAWGEQVATYETRGGVGSILDPRRNNPPSVLFAAPPTPKPRFSSQTSGTQGN
jgi:phosphatidylethanolamine-binding protein (PEBP) family uncharacterized protein